MREIKNGEIVRFKDGKIQKVDKDDAERLNIFNDNVAKHSKNIIDLIEVGDYVNGMEVCKDKVASGKEKLLVRNHIINGMSLEVVKIRTILTHEIYKNNCYEVEE